MEYATLRLSPDGARLTVLNGNSIMIVDRQTMVTVYADQGGYGRYGDDTSSALTLRSAVSESGEYVVTFDNAGVVTWRRVTDISVASKSVIPRSTGEKLSMASDTIAYVSSDDGGYYVSVHGVVTRSDSPRAPQMMNDSIVVYESVLRTYIVNRHTDDTLATLKGYSLGLDFARRLYTAGYGPVIVRHRYGTAVESDTVLQYAANVEPRLIRGQFLTTPDTLIDLMTNTSVSGVEYPDDILPSRQAVKAAYQKSAIVIVSPTGVADTVQAFDGPLTSVLQDPRDSSFYVYMRGDNSRARSGYLGFVSDSAVYLGDLGGLYSVKLQTPSFVHDSLTTTFWTPNNTGWHGYYNLDCVRAKHSPLGVMMSDTIPPYPEFYLPSYTFSSNGIRLRSRSWHVDFGQCPTDTVISQPRGVIGFVPTTPFYVVGREAYSVDDCDYYFDLEYPVTSIAPYRDRILITTDDRILLTEIVRPQIRHNSTSSDSITFGAWSDSGRTVRLIRNNNAIISLHSDGSIDSINIPVAFQILPTQWLWSNDGTVATAIKHDSLISIDVRDGKVLREYFDAPWLAYYDDYTRAFCFVGPIDGRLIVSLQNGCFATFPGVTLPVISSVTQSSPLWPHTLVGTRIVGALAQSVVTVYSLLGTVVLQVHVDDSGSIELSEKGLPHGAYAVVFATQTGGQSALVLL